MSDSGDIIQLDELALMMWTHLQAHLQDEPEPANGGEPLHLANERAQVHEEWTKELMAIRLMLGIRLIRLVEDQLGQKGAQPG